MGHMSSFPSFLQSTECLQQTHRLSWHLVGKQHALQAASSPTASRLLLLPWLHQKRPRFLQEVHVPAALTLWLSSSSSLLTAPQVPAGAAGTAWWGRKTGVVLYQRKQSTSLKAGAEALPVPWECPHVLVARINTAHKFATPDGSFFSTPW